ncbi:hypothetical protein [Selenomonas noxia]|jgi:hypothetical protein|uniref:hypothetical protein n=1 Tax=Selenomonas noxia TaxID=135083 RepID=UPI00205F606B|nr:hypothetical protein [Selenomonas noxia]DAU62136.1 MAG TPA: hypothetical protein [Caudoviricetes sp.]
MIQNEQLGIPNEPYMFSADRMVDTLRSAGTTGEKILRAAALSFLRGLEVGRSAKMADVTAADGGKEKQPV